MSGTMEGGRGGEGRGGVEGRTEGGGVDGNWCCCAYMYGASHLCVHVQEKLFLCIKQLENR